MSLSKLLDPHNPAVSIAYEISAKIMEQLEKLEREEGEGDCDTRVYSFSLGKNS